MENLLDQRTVTASRLPLPTASATHEVPGTLRAPARCPRPTPSWRRSMSFAIGVLDPNLAPFGLRMRDNAETARPQVERFIEAYREVVG